MLLFLIRHGDPIYNPDSLTPLGQRQAEAVAKRLASHGIDRLYSSSSTRAMLTAQPTAELTKKDIISLDWCREDLAWKNLSVPFPDGHRRWAFLHPDYRILFNSDEVRKLGDQWYTHPAMAKTHFGEGITRIQDATDMFLSGLGYAHDHESHSYIPENPTNDRIALFAHHGFGLAFLSCLLDIPYPQFATHFDMGFTGVTAIEFAGEKGNIFPSVLQLSNDAHLYRDGLPTKYVNGVYI